MLFLPSKLKCHFFLLSKLKLQWKTRKKKEWKFVAGDVGKTRLWFEDIETKIGSSECLRWWRHIKNLFGYFDAICTQRNNPWWKKMWSAINFHIFSCFLALASFPFLTFFYQCKWQNWESEEKEAWVEVGKANFFQMWGYFWVKTCRKAVRDGKIMMICVRCAGHPLKDFSSSTFALQKGFFPFTIIQDFKRVIIHIWKSRC